MDYPTIQSYLEELNKGAFLGHYAVSNDGMIIHIRQICLSKVENTGQILLQYSSRSAQCAAVAGENYPTIDWSLEDALPVLNIIGYTRDGNEPNPLFYCWQFHLIAGQLLFRRRDQNKIIRSTIDPLRLLMTSPYGVLGMTSRKTTPPTFSVYVPFKPNTIDDLINLARNSTIRIKFKPIVGDK